MFFQTYLGEIHQHDGKGFFEVFSLTMFYLEMGSSSDIVVPGEGMVMSRKSMVVQGVLLMRTSCNMAVQWRDGDVKE